MKYFILSFQISGIINGYIIKQIKIIIADKAYNLSLIYDASNKNKGSKTIVNNILMDEESGSSTSFFIGAYGVNGLGSFGGKASEISV